MTAKEKIKTQMPTIKKVGFIVLYSLLIIGVCLGGGLIFHKYYYTVFYIMGQSMYPTLNGDGTSLSDPLRKDFGIVDTNQATINGIKRFDIVTTYYASDYNTDGELIDGAEKKIKRVIALPGEKVETKSREIKIDGKVLEIPFTPGPGSIATYVTTEKLGDDEYFVMGDNWGNSSDSSKLGPIKKAMINGVLIAIEGTCILENGLASDFKYHWPTFYK